MRLFFSLLAVCGIAAFLLISSGSLSGHGPVRTDSASLFEGTPRLSEDRRVHILYGDDYGGGHHHSANKPCKSEFPESWDERKIIKTVQQLAANDNAPWRQEDNGYYVAEHPYEDLKIRVVLDREADDIVTAYPVNVKRNPCEAANDNIMGTE
jgi:hypothetical protein